MAKIKIVGTALVAAALVAGCSKNETTDVAPDVAAAPAEDPKEVMVSAGGKDLTRGAIAEKVDEILTEILKKEGNNLPAEQLAYQKRMIAAQIAQSFILDNVVVTKATELGYKLSDDDFKAFADKVLKKFEGRPDAPKTIDEFAEKMPLPKDYVMSQFKNQALIEKMIEGEVSSKNKADYTAKAKEIVNDIKEKNKDSEPPAPHTISAADSGAMTASIRWPASSWNEARPGSSPAVFKASSNAIAASFEAGRLSPGSTPHSRPVSALFRTCIARMTSQLRSWISRAATASSAMSPSFAASRMRVTFAGVYSDIWSQRLRSPGSAAIQRPGAGIPPLLSAVRAE